MKDKDAELKDMLLKKAQRALNNTPMDPLAMRSELTLVLGIALGLLARVEQLEQQLDQRA
jgi:hypothetical protein